MAEPSNDVERELVNLEAELKRLEAEYTMYFAGRLKRPPVETDRAMTFTDPAHDVDKLRALHEKVSDARQQTGQAAVPFDEFAELVRGQVAQMKEQGRGEVAFRVAVKDGKVSLTAKGSKGGDGTGGA